MATRYVPPALRRKDGASVNCDGTNVVNGENLVARRLSDLQLDEPLGEILYTLPEIASHFWPDGETSHSTTTLHAAADTPKQLRYILLFRDANPQWHSDRIIFAKTNLDLLPGWSEETETHTDLDDISQEQLKLDGNRDAASTGATEADHTSTRAVDLKMQHGDRADHPGDQVDRGSTLLWDGQIGVFEQPAEKRSFHRNFRFVGWYKLGNVDFLSPHSKELVRMLQQKWNFRVYCTQGSANTQRSAEQWQQSLSHRWAVIKMSENDKSFEKSPPKIITDKSSDSVGRENCGRENRRRKRGGRGFLDRRHWRDEMDKRQVTVEERTEDWQDEMKHHE